MTCWRFLLRRRRRRGKEGRKELIWFIINKLEKERDFEKAWSRAMKRWRIKLKNFEGKTWFWSLNVQLITTADALCLLAWMSDASFSNEQWLIVEFGSGRSALAAENLLAFETVVCAALWIKIVKIDYIMELVSSGFSWRVNLPGSWIR